MRSPECTWTRGDVATRTGLGPQPIQHRRQRLLGRAIRTLVSLLVVPLFVIANLGVKVDATLLHRAFTGPITRGILCGLLVGKPTRTPWPLRE